MGARSLLALIYAVVMRKKLVLWAYNTIHTEKNISKMRKLFRKILCRFPDSFIGMGTEARKYLKHLGVKDEIIFEAKNATETDKYAVDLSSEHREIKKKQVGLSGLVYLYVGHFTELKGIHYLINSWKVFSQNIEHDVSLFLVGDGGEKKNILDLAEKTRLKNIEFLPFIQPDNLGEIYAISDVFVFPTLGDVWGLVVNEAMAAGLPIICSKYAGCNTDLIVEKRNGWIFDPFDEVDFVNKLHMAYENFHNFEDMGKLSKEIVSCINLNQMARGFRKAVDFVLRNNSINEKYFSN
jgi:glycosyltransferase involved in cell wall biosynthesis